MSLDSPLALCFIYLFFISNLFGWGWLHETYFFIFSVSVGFIYILLDILNLVRKNEFAVKAKIIVLLLFLLISVFGVTAQLIFLRNRTISTNYISDSALQTEIAGRFVLLGKNPYVTDYDNTDLMQWKYADAAGRTINPAVYHNVIPPFLIASSAVGFRIFSRLFGFFDVRILFLFAYFSVILLGFIKFKFSKYALLFLIFVCMNPLFNINMIKGANDIVVIALLLWSLFLLEKKHIMLSSLLLGLSIATKQTAWFAAPFYFFYAFQLFGKNTFKKFLFMSVLVAFAFYAPFIFNDFGHTFSNLIFYPISHPYADVTTHPIEGYGFSQLMYITGMVRSIYAAYPFWIYQLIIGTIFLLFLLSIQRKTISSSSVLYSSALLTGVVWFFNRYFLETHLAYILILICASAVWIADKKAKNQHS